MHLSSNDLTPDSSCRSQSDWTRFRFGLQVWLGRTIVILVTVGLLLRLSIRDAVPYLSTIYYATPLPLLSAGLIVALYLMRGSSSLRTRLLFQGVSFLCAFAFWFYHYEIPAASGNRGTVQLPHGGKLKVAFWNVARGVRGWDPVFAALRSFDADVIGIVECDPLDEQMLSRLRREFSDCEVAEFSHSMVLLSRYPITFQENRNDCGADFGVACIQFAGQELQFVVADITGHPLHFRKGPIESLGDIATEFRERPTVIMGDFNTPIESVFLEPLRDNYLNTIEQGGRGFDCTWPVPCPVLTIDQMWVNQSWKVQSSQLGWTWVSDHRPIVSEISLNPTRQLVAAKMRPAQNL